MKNQDEGDSDFDYLFKIVLIGDAGVGKTAIVHRFKYNTFVERHASTIGVDFTIKTMQVDDKKIKVNISYTLHCFTPIINWWLGFYIYYVLLKQWLQFGIFY